MIHKRGPEAISIGKASVHKEHHETGASALVRPKVSSLREKHNLVEMAEHSLQGAVEEFKKICEPNISMLKGGYSANAALIFNS